MKNLLIATDFSANARHAAFYGYQLAAKLKANLILCNAFIVPAAVPEAGLVSWPLYEYDELQKNSADELKLLKADLEKANDTIAFRPAISCVNRAGTVADIIDEIADKNIQLIIIGTHRNSGLSQFLLGDHSRSIIDETTFPLLLVPLSATFISIKKIAFATDFKEPEKDLQTIFELIELIRPLSAELLLTHIHDEKYDTPKFKEWVDNFMLQISNKADYPHIFYRVVKSDTPEKGLEWLCEHGNIDILVMAHRERSFWGKIFTGSHTQKMAGRIEIPLLVLHENA